MNGTQVESRQPEASPERSVDAPGEPEVRRRPGANRLLGWGERYALLLLLVAAAGFFTVYGPTADTFPTSGNIRILLAGQSVLAIIALAALIPLVCQQFDLSVGAIAGVSSVFTAAAFSSGTPMLLAILLGIGIGLLAGTINALLIVKVGINAVITTIGTAALMAGIVSQKTNGLAVVANIPDAVRDFGSGTTLGVPRSVYVLVLVALLVYYMLNQTPLGRYLYALGANEQAARLVGLRNDLLLGMTFVMSGTLAGAAGVLQVAYAGGADPKVGESFTLPALAAAFLSAAAIRPGRYNVGGVLVAIFFIAVLNSGLNLAGAAPYVSDYVNGAALLIGVGLAVFVGRRREASVSGY